MNLVFFCLSLCVEVVFLLSVGCCDCVVLMANPLRPQIPVTEDPEVLVEELSSDNLGNEDLASKVLVGNIRSTKIFNVKAVKDILSEAWASIPGVHITELGKNIFCSISLKKQMHRGDEKTPVVRDESLTLFREVEPSGIL